MKLSNYYLKTYKESPAEATLISHQLMLRAGFIRKLAAGLYTWLPMGLRVLRKIERIVREEMDRAGAIELLMPNIQPAELWQESERWDSFGPLLLKMTDQKKRSFCYGPTHEEVITDLARHGLSSYQDLPLNFYQIQTKFRDEIRPRFGVMRAREFLMKDAYSFDLDKAGLEKSYQKMYDAYTRIFDRCELTYRSVEADSGSIGGSVSREFHVLANSGEDCLLYSDSSDYAANQEEASCFRSVVNPPAPKQALKKFATPGIKTIAALSDQMKIDTKQTIKVLIVQGKNTPYVALILRGDHTLNTIKATKQPDILSPLTFVPESDIKMNLQLSIGSIGPINLSIPILADFATASMHDFVCGANETGYHFKGVNWGRDCDAPRFVDLRQAEAGDPSPDGKGHLKMCRGIEVGHIFQLGTKYAIAMNANVLDPSGRQQPLEMGCYGIGVSRIVAATIEQNHHEDGICWPEPLAPFQIVIVAINGHKSSLVQQHSCTLYDKLTALGYDVLLDDRDKRLGIMLSDLDLIGIPHQILIGERGLKTDNCVEYQSLKNKAHQKIFFDNCVEFIQKIIKKL